MRELTYGKSGEFGTFCRFAMNEGRWMSLVASGTDEKNVSTRWCRMSGGGMLSGQLWMVIWDGPAVGWVKMRPGRSVTLYDETRMSPPSATCKGERDVGGSDGA